MADKVEKKEIKETKEKLIKVTLIHGTNGCREKQIKTVQALGLRKINSSKVIKDNDAARGMIAVVAHLVKVEEVK
jgi:large subunit ribosomal protein L30